MRKQTGMLLSIAAASLASSCSANSAVAADQGSSTSMEVAQRVNPSQALTTASVTVLRIQRAADQQPTEDDVITLGPRRPAQGSVSACAASRASLDRVLTSLGAARYEATRSVDMTGAATLTFFLEGNDRITLYVASPSTVNGKRLVQIGDNAFSMSAAEFDAVLHEIDACLSPAPSENSPPPGVVSPN